MEYLSTTALANELDIKSSELFDKLKSLGFMERKDEKWVLTEFGRQKGGQMRNNPKFGEYIVWPENLSINNGQEFEKPKLLNATTIGKHFDISSQRLNLILSELGWIEKNIAGWRITRLGKDLGGKQCEHESSGGSYVLWPDNILSNKNLNNVFKEVTLPEHTTVQTNKVLSESNNDNFREKFPAKFRTKDGHFVRSRAEVIIDNALYDYNLAHAYERKLPIEEELYPDFYLPNGKVFIEFWGLEEDPKYAERKKAKIEIYKKYDFNLIELNDSDISNLDDHLPKKLLKYSIKVY
ncbi:MAG: glycerol kinase [Ignavibacteriae bacterium]|nr:glycerol kinase [Ignavibacteriota bacterium]